MSATRAPSHPHRRAPSPPPLGAPCLQARCCRRRGAWPSARPTPRSLCSPTCWRRPRPTLAVRLQRSSSPRSCSRRGTPRSPSGAAAGRLGAVGLMGGCAGIDSSVGMWGGGLEGLGSWQLRRADGEGERQRQSFGGAEPAAAKFNEGDEAMPVAATYYSRGFLSVQELSLSPCAWLAAQGAGSGVRQGAGGKGWRPPRALPAGGLHPQPPGRQRRYFFRGLKKARCSAHPPGPWGLGIACLRQGAAGQA